MGGRDKNFKVLMLSSLDKTKMKCHFEYFNGKFLVKFDELRLVDVR